MTSLLQFFTSVLKLVIPYGKGKLLGVVLLSFLQALMQAAGIASIFPFIALIASPDRLMRSQFGSWLLGFLPPMDFQDLLVFSGFLAAIMLLASSMTNLIAEYVRAKYAYGCGHWLRNRLLVHVSRHRYEFFLDNDTSLLHKKIIADVQIFVANVLLPLIDSVTRLATVIALTALLLFVDIQIALGTLLLLGAIYVLLYFSMSKVRKSVSTGLGQTLSQLSKVTLEYFAGIKTIRLYDLENKFIGTIGGHSAQYAAEAAKVPMLANFPRYMIEPLAMGGLLAFIVTQGVNQSSLLDTLPNISVIAMVLYRLLPSIQMIFSQMTTLGSNRFAFDSLQEEFAIVDDAYPLYNDGESSLGIQFNQSLQLKDVSYSYTDAKTAVFDQVNATFYQGQTYAIAGPSGVGKTSLINLLAGLLTPQSGEILIDGQPLNDQNRRNWQRLIGFVTQDVFLLDGSIRDNIRLGRETKESDDAFVEEVCLKAGLGELVDGGGLDRQVGLSGIKLSGGQKQRIGIARALYRNPRLLILDEATSGLDPANEQAIMNIVANLGQDVMVLIISHSESMVSLCSAICRLQNGELLIDQNVPVSDDE